LTFRGLKEDCGVATFLYNRRLPASRDEIHGGHTYCLADGIASFARELELIPRVDELEPFGLEPFNRRLNESLTVILISTNILKEQYGCYLIHPQ